MFGSAFFWVAVNAERRTLNGCRGRHFEQALEGSNPRI
jgi:hypothetical protein